MPTRHRVWVFEGVVKGDSLEHFFSLSFFFFFSFFSFFFSHAYRLSGAYIAWPNSRREHHDGLCLCCAIRTRPQLPAIHLLE